MTSQTTAHEKSEATKGRQWSKVCVHGAPGGEQRIPVKDPETGQAWSPVRAVRRQDWVLPRVLEGSEIGRLCVRKDTQELRDAWKDQF